MRLPSLDSIRIALKLPFAVIGACALVGVGVGVAAYFSAASILEKQGKEHLASLLQNRKAGLQRYLGTIEQDLVLVASNAATLNALRQFETAWSQVEGEPENTLQKLYIEDNPHPTGAKENLNEAGDGSAYSRVHAEYHPWFRQLQRERGYYDIFLFDKEGNLVYTVFKELDFATNLNTGLWNRRIGPRLTWQQPRTKTTGVSSSDVTTSFDSPKSWQQSLESNGLTASDMNHSLWSYH